MNVEESFKSIAVNVGRKAGDFIEITQGVNEGDKIVLSAQFLIDSESSKTSDFKRMQSHGDHGVHHQEVNHEAKHHEGMHHD